MRRTYEAHGANQSSSRWMHGRLDRYGGLESHARIHYVPAVSYQTRTPASFCSGREHGAPHRQLSVWPHPDRHGTTQWNPEEECEEPVPPSKKRCLVAPDPKLRLGFILWREISSYVEPRPIEHINWLRLPCWELVFEYVPSTHPLDPHLEESIRLKFQAPLVSTRDQEGRVAHIDTLDIC